LFSRSTSLCK